MKKHTLTMLCIGVLFASCSKKEDTTPSNPTNNTTTVKAGTVFTYKLTDYDNQTGTNVVSTSQYTITLLRDTTYANDKWFVVERKDSAGSQYGLIKFGTDGIYNTKNGVPKMDMKFNAAVGDTWTDASDQTCKVISLNQTVTVPKGTFSNATYVERNDANSLENKTWYNDKEYLLKNEEYDESPTTPGTMIIDYREELVDIKY